MFNSSGIKLLLVLTEPVLADLTSFRLELLGYQVQRAANGSEAIALINKAPVDLVLVDTMLRDGDGLEWVARCRADQTVGDTAFLVVSLDTSLETVERAHHAGASDYLISPFDPTVLEEKIERLVATRAFDGTRKRFSTTGTSNQGSMR